jgi:phosphoglycolate phosphatase/putative hydrolase of the HAD superfamily
VNVYRLQAAVQALLFDMDLTLYSHAEYGRIQVDALIALAGKKRGLSFEEARQETETVRREWAALHGGQGLSLSSIFLSWGFTMEENIRWREEAYNPEAFLRTDRRLGETLKELSSAYRLALVTNNPVSIARRTLSALGAADYFSVIVGLDTCMVHKPHRLPFATAAEGLGVPWETCVSIGDRYDIDLALPLEMGMGGILVDGVEDVYKLPGILGSRR